MITMYNLWQEVNVHSKKHIYGVRKGIVKEIFLSSTLIHGPGVLYKVEGQDLSGYYSEYQLESPDKEHEEWVMENAGENYKRLAMVCREDN